MSLEYSKNKRRINLIKNGNKNLIENFVAVALTQIIMYVFPLITLPYLSRVLGAEKFGLVFWAQSTIMYGFMLTDFGFNNSAVREFSIHRENSEKMSDIFSSIMFIKPILTVISFILLAIAIFFIPKFHSEAFLFFMTFFMVIGNVLYPMYLFQGIEHMKYITILNVISKTLFLIFIFIFVRNQTHYILVAFFNSLAYIIPGILAIYMANKRFNIKLRIPSKEEIIHQIKYSSEFFLSRISVAGYTNTNTFVIGLLFNPILVGYYVAAEKIYTALSGIAAPFSQVLYPYIAKSKNIIKYKKIFKYAFIFFVCIAIFVFIFAKDIVNIFYGAELLPAYVLLRFFCFTLIFGVTSNLLGFPLLGGMGYTKDANMSIIFGSIWHLLCLLLLVLLHVKNINMIAMLTIATEFIVLLYRIIKIKKYKLWDTRTLKVNEILIN